MSERQLPVLSFGCVFTHLVNICSVAAVRCFMIFPYHFVCFFKLFQIFCLNLKEENILNVCFEVIC